MCPDRRHATSRQPFVEQQPRRHGDEYHLHIRDDGAEAGAYKRNRLVPEREIHRQDQAADDREPALARGASIAAALHGPDYRENRQRVRRA